MTVFNSTYALRHFLKEEVSFNFKKNQSNKNEFSLQDLAEGELYIMTEMKKINVVDENC